MATPDEIAELRLLINEPDASNGWTDERLSDIIDAETTLNSAAASIWTSKASTYAELVDVSESGSTRKLGDLHKNALAMADRFAGLDGTPDQVGGGPVIARIRRGFS